jgi:hypothetical protein
MTKTAKEIAENAFERAKKLQEFVVECKLPDGFQFYGTVPFDLTIQDSILKAKVYALTEEEADGMLQEYVRNGTLI